MKYFWLLIMSNILYGMESDSERVNLLADGSHSSSSSSIVDSTFVSLSERGEGENDEDLLMLVRQFKELIIQHVPEYEGNEVALSFLLKTMIDSALNSLKENGKEIDLRKVQYDYGYYVRSYLQNLVPTSEDGRTRCLFPPPSESDPFL